MSTEDRGILPIPSTQASDPVVSIGLEIAMKWGAVAGTDKLEVALKALEPQLRRDHKERLVLLDMQRDAAELKSREKREERAHKRHMAGVIAGAVIAIAMLGAGVYVAKDAWWLATLLCGPSLLALAKIFVLRRSDPDDMKLVARAARTSTSAASQAQPPSPPIV